MKVHTHTQLWARFCKRTELAHMKVFQGDAPMEYHADMCDSAKEEEKDIAVRLVVCETELLYTFVA